MGLKISLYWSELLQDPQYSLFRVTPKVLIEKSAGTVGLNPLFARLVLLPPDCIMAVRSHFFEV